MATDIFSKSSNFWLLDAEPFSLIFHYSLPTSFRDVQTSVAVISPSKAKSVCSLSVCFRKQAQSIPSSEQEKERIQLVKSLKTQRQPTSLLFTTYENRMVCTSVSVSCMLSVDATDKKKNQDQIN